MQKIWCPKIAFQGTKGPVEVGDEVIPIKIGVNQVFLGNFFHISFVIQSLLYNNLESLDVEVICGMEALLVLLLLHVDSLPIQKVGWSGYCDVMSY